METPLTEPTSSISFYDRKITRYELAATQGISLRHVDELTRRGVLPHYKIGKSVRYDLAEVDAALRERFHVNAKAKKARA